MCVCVHAKARLAHSKPTLVEFGPQPLNIAQHLEDIGATSAKPHPGQHISRDQVRLKSPRACPMATADLRARPTKGAMGAGDFGRARPKLGRVRLSSARVPKIRPEHRESACNTASFRLRVCHLLHARSVRNDHWRPSCLSGAETHVNTDK